MTLQQEIAKNIKYIYDIDIPPSISPKLYQIVTIFPRGEADKNLFKALYYLYNQGKNEEALINSKFVSMFCLFSNDSYELLADENILLIPYSDTMECFVDLGNLIKVLGKEY